MLGTEPYAKYTSEMKELFTRSECHTLDRDNLQAQQDSCNLSSRDEWHLAVDLQFNVTHWPYIQSSANYNCVQKFFVNSYTNLAIDSAVTHSLNLIVSLIVISLTAW